MSTRLRRTALAVFLVVVIGAIGARIPLALAAVIVVLGLTLVLSLAAGRENSLAIGFFLVLLAETKFRNRDAGALLSGQIDAQIGFELALYSVVVLLTAINVVRIPLGRLRPGPNERFLICYALFAVASFLWSPTPGITAVRGMQQLMLLTFLFVAIRVLGPQRFLRSLTMTLVFSVLICAAFALIFPWAKGPLEFETWHKIPRFSWFAVHPITAACEAGAAAVLLLSEQLYGFALSKKRILMQPLRLFYVPVIAILLATRARGAILAALASALLLIIRPRVSSWMAASAAIALFTLVVLVSVAGFDLANPLFSAVVSEDNPVGEYLLRGQSMDQFLTLSGRTELWQGAYELFLKQPILGHGYVASRSILLGVESWAGEAHNALVESLLDLGLIGTILIWLPVLRTFSGSLRMIPGRQGMIWPFPVVSAVLIFVLFEGFVTAGFAGFLTYDPTLLFSSICLFDALLARPARHGIQPAISKMPAGIVTMAKESA